LIDELTVEDEAVRQRLRECVVQRLEGDLDDFDRGLAQRAGLTDLSGQATRHAPHEGLTGNPPPFAGFARVAGPRSAYAGREIAGVGRTENPAGLCHPDWYVGFWKHDTYLRLRVAPAEGSDPRPGLGADKTPTPGQGGGLTRISGFGFAPTDDLLAPAREFRVGQGRPNLGRVGRAAFQFGSRSGGPIITFGIEPQLDRDHVEKIASFTPFPPLAHPRGVGLKNPPPPPAGVGYDLGDGILTVWRADQWAHQVPPNCDYCDTDLFDRVRMTIEADEPFCLLSLQIVLNDIEIAFVNFGGLTMHRGQMREWDFADHIAESRRHRLLYRYDPTRLFPGYEPTRIMSNPVLRVASQELGQGWSGKYDAAWHFHHGRWLDAPGEWCSEFVRWCLRVGRGMHGLPDGSIWDGDLMGYFAARDRWLCANNLGWEHVGERVRPGFYSSVKNGGHSAMFMYWLQPNSQAAASHDSAHAMARDISLGPRRDAADWALPGEFDPTVDINWFMGIGGNQKGQMSVELWAFARIDEYNSSWIDVLFRNEDEDGVTYGVMIWKPSRDREISVFDGFGDDS
jgi:hypothetical protein